MALGVSDGSVLTLTVNRLQDGGSMFIYDDAPETFGSLISEVHQFLRGEGEVSDIGDARRSQTREASELAGSQMTIAHAISPILFTTSQILQTVLIV